jgi:putative endonuclease
MPASLPAARRMAAERRGRFAEAICVLWLRLTGWRILARRHKARAGTGLGEIDIVAKRGNTLAFIEVKARVTHELARDTVAMMQRSRIARAAETFIARREDCAGCAVRFDVMVVDRRYVPLRIVDAWRPD